MVVPDIAQAAPRIEGAHDEPTANSQRVRDDIDFVPTTGFGRRLLELRRRAIAAGQPLLTRQELEREIAERRGGIYGCDGQ